MSFDVAAYNERLKKRLLKKRVITAEGCWEFTGHVGKTGYGQIYYINSLWGVHRLSLKLFKPLEFIYELQTNHKCGNRRCFNPDHLYSGDQADNRNDAIRSGAWQNQHTGKTHCSRGHELTVENTYIAPKTGYRQCKICKNSGMIYRRLIGKAS